MKHAVAFIAGLVLSLAGTNTARAQDEPTAETYFSILGSALVESDQEHVPELDTGYGLDLRYGGNSGGLFGYEFRAFYGVVQPLDTAAGADGNRGGAGIDALLPLFNAFGVTPYLLAGGGIVYFDKLQTHDQVGMYLNGGAGLYTNTLRLMDWPFRLRLEGRYSLEDYREAYGDVYAFFGLDIPLSVTEVPPPAPEPVQVVQAVEPEPAPAAAPPAPEPVGPQDTDEDGVDDDKDRCPGSPKGKPVDNEGCTILKVLTLRGVNFEVGSDKLKPESAAVLDDAVLALNKEFLEARIEVAGHTDSTGKDSYNLKLSQRRAQSVLNYLVGQGVEQSRLNAQGYGETEPVDNNDTAEGRSLNRRVELRVKGDPAPEPMSLNPRANY